MATKLLEGFDNYGPTGVLLPSLYASLATSGWTVSGSGLSIATVAAGLAGVGQSLKLHAESAGSGTQLLVTRGLQQNFTRIIGGFRTSISYPSNIGYGGIIFVDNSTAQCSIYIEPLSGFVSLRQGDHGAALATGAVAIAYNTAHYIEYDITFGGAGVGTYSIWLDNNLLFSGVGQTQQSGNAFCNLLQLSTVTTASNTIVEVKYDDMYIRDHTTSFANVVLNTSPVVLTSWGSGDHQTQFANTGNIFGHYTSVIPTNYSPGANIIYLTKIIPDLTSTSAASIELAPETTSFVANFKPVIYADSAGVPGTLIGTGPEVTSCVAGTALNLPFTTTHALSAFSTYWIGFITDTALAYAEADTTLQGYVAANAYSSGAPSSAPAMTGDQGTLLIYAVCSGAAVNWESLSLNPPIGDNASVTSNTPGDTDLYTFPALPSNVTDVYAVGVSGYCRVLLGGGHTVDLVMSSSGTEGAGAQANLVPLSSFSWLTSYFDTDPHTAGGWTPTTVTAAYCGMENVS